MRLLISALLLLSLASCFEAERDCRSFKTGKFKFEATVNGKKQVTLFERSETMEIEHFQGKTDTSSIRWVGDCEYVLQKLHPKSRAERQGIAIKILTTTENSYTFEFGEVGSTQMVKGTATRIDN